MDVPDIRYASSGDVAIAYQAVGSAPVNFIFVRGFAGDLLCACVLSRPRPRRGSGIEFEERGMHTLKGVPAEWRLYAAAVRSAAAAQ